MPVTDLLADVDARYRNTFTQDQKIFWMNLVQRDIFRMLHHEPIVYLFQTVANQTNYPLPLDCQINAITSLEMETYLGSGIFKPLSFYQDKDVQDGQYYSIDQVQIFLYPTPDTTNAGTKLNLYYIKYPADLTASSTPDLDVNFHELLILGTLERVAGARKDAVMKNNYQSDFQNLLDDFQFLSILSEPEMTGPTDTLPRIRRAW